MSVLSPLLRTFLILIQRFDELRHSDITGQSVTSDDMLTLGGLDLTDYFPM